MIYDDESLMKVFFITCFNCVIFEAKRENKERCHVGDQPDGNLSYVISLTRSTFHRICEGRKEQTFSLLDTFFLSLKSFFTSSLTFFIKFLSQGKYIRHRDGELIDDLCQSMMLKLLLKWHLKSYKKCTQTITAMK
jgi:hypothetical protein